jgi:hypothetical protein
MFSSIDGHSFSIRTETIGRLKLAFKPGVGC